MLVPVYTIVEHAQTTTSARKHPPALPAGSISVEEKQREKEGESSRQYVEPFLID